MKIRESGSQIYTDWYFQPIGEPNPTPYTAYPPEFTAAGIEQVEEAFMKDIFLAYFNDTSAYDEPTVGGLPCGYQIDYDPAKLHYYLDWFRSTGRTRLKFDVEGSLWNDQGYPNDGPTVDFATKDKYYFWFSYSIDEFTKSCNKLITLLNDCEAYYDNPANGGSPGDWAQIRKGFYSVAPSWETLWKIKYINGEGSAQWNAELADITGRYDASQTLYGMVQDIYYVVYDPNWTRFNKPFYQEGAWYEGGDAPEINPVTGTFFTLQQQKDKWAEIWTWMDQYNALKHFSKPYMFHLTIRNANDSVNGTMYTHTDVVKWILDTWATFPRCEAASFWMGYNPYDQRQIDFLAQWQLQHNFIGQNRSNRIISARRNHNRRRK